MKIVLLGSPGSGKGSVAQKLIHEYNIPQISTGDIFRNKIKDNSPLSKELQKILSAGQLVPDELTIQIVKERLQLDDCKNGYILDGFPRTLFQATALEEFSKTDIAIYLKVTDELVLSRLSGRRFCPDCNGTFHIRHLNGSNFCPNCSSQLVVRQDDSLEAVKSRLEVYKNTSQPLVSFYEQLDKLAVIDGAGEIDEVVERIKKVLD